MKQEEQITFGQYIAEAMKCDKRTRDQIAADVGIDGPRLSRIKADQAPVSPRVLEGLIQELQLDPEKAQRLAEAAAVNRTVDKMRRQMTHIQRYLIRQAPEALREVIEEVSRDLQASFLSLAGIVYQKLLQESPQAAGEGMKVLVVDAQQGTAYDIPMKIVRGPELNEEAEVLFQLHTDYLEDLPEEFFLDFILLFAVPAPESLCSMRVGPQERELLGTTGGLEFRAKLPGTTEAAGLRQEVSRLLRRRGEDRLRVELGGWFAFRIRR